MRTVETEKQNNTLFTNRSSNSLLYSLNKASVAFDKTKALSDISLNINSGEILFITGKSGAGKTTLLNLLAGDQSVSSGRIDFNLKGRFVAQVFQDLRLFDNKTVEENLWYAFDKKIYKNRNDFYHDLQELCGVLGIKSKLSLKISQANGGLKQKVAIIRALLTRPSVLLADEPTSAMDKESAVKMFEVLNYYNSKRKLTIIWASHNRDLVREFPGQILHLDQGRLVYSGHACFI